MTSLIGAGVVAILAVIHLRIVIDLITAGPTAIRRRRLAGIILGEKP